MVTFKEVPMNKTAYILIGAPASGKSTWAKDFVNKSIRLVAKEIGDFNWRKQ